MTLMTATSTVWIHGIRAPFVKRSQSRCISLARSLSAAVRTCRQLPHHSSPSQSSFVRPGFHNHRPRWKTASSSSSTKKSSTSSPQQSDTLTSIIYPKSLAIGTFAGMLGSLAGMGGGFVMIPLMTGRWMGLSQHAAHGTSLFAVAATGMAGASSYRDAVQWEEAAAIALTGMLTARLGAQTAGRLSAQALKRALGVLMLAMGPAVHVKQYLMEQHTVEEATESSRSTSDEEVDNNPQNDTPSTKDLWQRVLPASAIGVFSGFMAGLFGVGGGVIVVPALTLLTDCPTHYQALGTSLAAMTLPAVVGTWTHYQAGNVALRVAPLLAVGAYCGAYAGGQMAQNYTSENTLRWGFSSLLVVLGLQTIVKAG